MNDWQCRRGLFREGLKSKSFGELVHSVSLLRFDIRESHNRSVASLYVRGNLSFFVYNACTSVRSKISTSSLCVLRLRTKPVLK